MKAVVRRFAGDRRVLGWDIYNEIGNIHMPALSMAGPERAAALRENRHRGLKQYRAAVQLTQLAFEWARSEDPSQPLTAGVYNGDKLLDACCRSCRTS